MKLRELESILSQVDVFEEPKFELEQYPTSAHLASRLLYTADTSFDDIEDKAVLDLGCGTGMLGIGASILGSGYTLGLDIDPDALEIANRNVDDFELENMDFVHTDVSTLLLPDGSPGPLLESMQARFDTVVMNPPFGTRRKGIDALFLQVALKLCTGAVYSMHKSSTRSFLEKKATRDWNVKFEVVAQLRFDIPKMYKFHTKKSVDVMVDLIRLSRHAGSEVPTLMLRSISLREESSEDNEIVDDEQQTKTEEVSSTVVLPQVVPPPALPLENTSTVNDEEVVYVSESNTNETQVQTGAT